MAGIVIKNDFIQAGTHRAFEQYINYINRKEKTEEIKYTGYFDYVDRDRTAFTLDKDVLTDKEIQLIKNIFNGSKLIINSLRNKSYILSLLAKRS